MNQVYLLVRLTGEYEDFCESPIRVYADGAKAEADRATLEAWLTTNEEALRAAAQAKAPLPPHELDTTFSTSSYTSWDAQWRVYSVEFVP